MRRRVRPVCEPFPSRLVEQQPAKLSCPLGLLPTGIPSYPCCPLSSIYQPHKATHSLTTHQAQKCCLSQHPQPISRRAPKLTLHQDAALPQASSAGCLQAAASCAPQSNRQPWTCTTTGYGPTIPVPLWSHRARRARKVGPGSRPLPEGIEVCCRPRAHGRSPWCRPAPASCHQQQAQMRQRE